MPSSMVFLACLDRATWTVYLHSSLQQYLSMLQISMHQRLRSTNSNCSDCLGFAVNSTCIASCWLLFASQTAWHRVPTDLESQGFNLVREFCWWSGCGKMVCVVRVVSLFIFVEKMKIHIECMYNKMVMERSRCRRGAD